MLPRLVITSLPRSKCLLILWLQSPSAVIWDIDEPEITRGEAWCWTAGWWVLWRFLSLTLISSRKVLEQPGQQTAFARGHQPAFLIFYPGMGNGHVTEWLRWRLEPCNGFVHSMEQGGTSRAPGPLGPWTPAMTPLDSDAVWWAGYLDTQAILLSCWDLKVSCHSS